MPSSRDASREAATLVPLVTGVLDLVEDFGDELAPRRRRVWYLMLDRVPGLGATVFDHGRLLEAILEEDARRARALMREHVVEFERGIMAGFNRDRDPGPATDRSS